MPENEGGDSKFMTGFLLGFLLGVLICLGAGGAFVVVNRQRETARMMEMRMEADMERARAEEMRALAEAKAREAAEAVKAVEKKDK